MGSGLACFGVGRTTRPTKQQGIYVSEKKPGKFRNILVGVIALVAILIVIAVSGGPSTSGSTDQAAKKAEAAAPPPREVTAIELFRAYEANEAAAKKQYGDQRLLVTGTVAGVDLNLTDQPVVLLKTPNEFMSARADLADSAKDHASDLKKGETVKLLCAGVQEMMGVPLLSDCEFQ